jgi:hypothetical protein
LFTIRSCSKKKLIEARKGKERERRKIEKREEEIRK